MSVSNNIAEGFERGTTQELLTFLYIARGSSGETRSALYLCGRVDGFGDLKFEISNLKSKAEEVSRQLRAWADSLQNSDVRGQRYLTNKTKRASKEIREREDFLKELEQVRNRKGQLSDGFSSGAVNTRTYSLRSSRSRFVAAPRRYSSASSW